MIRKPNIETTITLATKTLNSNTFIPQMCAYNYIFILTRITYDNSLLIISTSGFVVNALNIFQLILRNFHFKDFKHYIKC